MYFYMVVFFIFISICACKLIIGTANIAKEAEDIVDVQKFYNSISELKPIIAGVGRVEISGYVVYYIAVRKDGVILYINAECIPVKSNKKYVRVRSEYSYALDELLVYTYND